jgi:Tetratricopeptide repeat
VADLTGTARDAAVGRLLRWYMLSSDAAATAVSPHRYNMPLDPAGAGPPPLGFTRADEALCWYDSERANLVAATRQAAADGLYDVAWRIPPPVFIVFESRNNWADCISTHRIALEAARRVGNRQGEAWVLDNLGEALGITGDSEGIGCLEQALAIRREIADRMGEAQAANNLADAYRRLGRRTDALDLLRRALDLLRRALDLNRAVGYLFGEGIALVNLGDVLLGLDRAEEAVDCLEPTSATEPRRRRYGPNRPHPVFPDTPAWPCAAPDTMLRVCPAPLSCWLRGPGKREDDHGKCSRRRGAGRHR